MADALESVCQQQADPAAFEILVVDNNSTDETTSVVRQFQERYPRLDIRYIHEKQQGLSHARNRGYQEARGEYVGYLDDDGKASTNWLETAWQVIENHHPEMFGGPYYAYYNAAKPPWFKDSYGSREMAQQRGCLQSHQFLSGGNMFLQRDTLVRLGGFDPSFGMTGMTLAYAEESELQKRIRRENQQVCIYYEPDLYMYHLVRPEKFSLFFQARDYWSKGRFRYIMDLVSKTEAPSMVKGLLRCLRGASLLVAYLVYIPVRNRERFPTWQNFMYEVGLRPLHGMGRGMAYFCGDGSQGIDDRLKQQCQKAKEEP